MSNLAILYWEAKMYDDAVYVGERMLKLARQINYEKGIGTALHHLGLAYEGMGEYIDALECYEEAYNLSRRINFGDLNRVLPGYIKKVEKNAKKMRKKGKTSIRKPVAVGDSGGAVGDSRDQRLYELFEIYKVEVNNKNYQKAHDAMIEAKEIGKDLNRSDVIGLSVGCIGNLYLLQDKVEEALRHLKEALNIVEDFADKIGDNFPDLLANIGLAYAKISSWETALKYYERALESFKSMGHQEGIEKSQRMIGQIKEKL
jgi:tetratricopeptide (TPR) repeat protein